MAGAFTLLENKLKQYRRSQKVRLPGAVTALAFISATLFANLVSNAQINVTTYHNDIGRTGQNVSETILTPSNVTHSLFGKLFAQPVDGQIYAQPLYLSGISINGTTHNVVYVATENDSVYAFDADSNTGSNASPLWQTSMLSSAHGAATGATTIPSSDIGSDINPQAGISGTPVIDPASGTLYVVSAAMENGAAIQRLHALDVTSGAEKFGGPIVITATVAGTGNGSVNGTLTFDSLWENQRPGLLLLNGIVYVAFASHGDNGPWHGWILGYNAATLKQTGAYCSSPNGTGSGFWMSGEGLAADQVEPTTKPYGRIFVPTGNGDYNAVVPYTNSMDYGDTDLDLDLTNGVPTVTDEFTTNQQSTLNSEDGDIGSGGLVVLPTQTGTYPHLAVQAGKSGTLYLLNRDGLGGFNATADQAVQEQATAVGVNGAWSSPAYWNGTVYYWGRFDYLKAFPLTNGLFSKPPTESTGKYGYPGATPSISANGTTNGIVWSIDSEAYADPGPAALEAHDASNVTTTLYSSLNGTRDTPGDAVKFAVPTIANGKVYVGTATEVDVFGLFNSASQTAAPVFTPGSETFNGTVSVTITDTNANATIYYTTNGSTPTTSSTLYTGPIKVASTETINAVASATGLLLSAESSATYTSISQTSAVSFSLATGTYAAGQSVTLTDSTANAVVYYTTDGSTPSSASTQYTAPIVVNATEKITAIAIAPGLTASAAVSNTYTIQTSEGGLSFAEGFASSKGIMILNGSADLDDSRLQLTDGAESEAGSAWYYIPLNIQSFTTTFTFQLSNPAGNGITFAIQNAAKEVNALGGNAYDLGYAPIANSLAVKFDLYNSNGEGADSTGLYLNGATPTTPAIDLSATGIDLHSGDTMSIQLAYNGSTLSMTITDIVTNATWSTNWTVDIPTTVGANTAYVGFTGATGSVTASQKILTWSFANSSATATAATPTFSVASGAYGSAQTVAIADATSGAAIYYTTNGAAPTASSTLYSAPITVSASETLNAIAIKANYTNSAVATAIYTINGTVATPTYSVAAGAYGSAQTVAIADATTGAAIYFTTNGATPTASSTLYSAPITVSASETLSAIAIKANYTSSAVATASYTINGALATPTFTVAPGAYGSAQTVAIADATAGAAIYYTTNGVTPTAASTLYSGPVTVSTSETLSAIAIKANYTNSAVATASYTINGALATPTFSVTPGAYGSAQTVAIADGTTGAAIYYTTNGATPTAASTLYSGPITISASETLSAIAIKANYTNSAVATASYTINGALATPTFSVAPGAYGSAQTVAIGDATTGAAIYYTTNGATPTAASTLYSGPITISASETLSAIAIKANYTSSAVATASYTINGALATPTFSVAPGAYGSAQTVAIADATTGAAIYYNTNGATPTAASTLYSGPITVSTSETLSAIAIKANYTSSAVATASYTINGALATPTFSVASGAYGSSQSVAIADSMAGASIYYTTNGATPTAASTLYSGPITVSASETLSAIAIKANYTNSAVATASYTINGALATPTFSVASGAYGSAQTVAIADATTGAAIYYTTNGATPTAASTLYSGPITISASETLSAIAIKANYTNSAVATASYTINGTVAMPTFSVSSGAYGSSQSVTIADSMAAASIYYTTNGATPTAASALYSVPIAVSASETLSAIAVKANYSNSAVATASYTINGAVATPTYSVAPGAYGSAQTVAIADATTGAAIYYTTNGAAPSASSTLYSGPITVSSSETLSAIAIAPNYVNSPIAASSYTINGSVATPTFSVAPGAYGSAQTVGIVDTINGAAIYYTTNGATPTTSSASYSGPITVSASETLSAIAVKANYTNSAVATASYTINGALATPTFSAASGAYGNTQTIAIAEATTGAAIYFTTNGATPTASSTLYSAPITVSASETLSVIAIKANYTNSAVATASYIINGAVATPTYSVASGAYGSAQTVAIADATTSAAIYYTTNGSAPTASSTLYSGPIAVSASETLSAIAIAPNYANSPIAAASYTINGSVATPTFSVAPGAYGPAQTVAITDATAGAAIYYTTNGATPTTASTLYSAPITVSSSETLTAIAIKANFTSSAIATTSYTINGAAATPTFSVAPGAYGPAQTVAIVDATAGAAIYYTTNGATPTTASTLYSAPITVSASETLSAIAIASNFTNSAIDSATYTINGAAATPTFSVAPGAYGPAQTIAIADATNGATIYYTTNGATPTSASTLYSAPITVSASETLTAIAIAPNFTNSPIASATYTINGAAATPSFSIAPGAYGPAQIIAITDATSGAAIYYTTNGATPTTASTLYSGPITISASETLSAIAIAPNFTSSPIASAAYTINGAAATPTFSVASGAYGPAQTVAIVDATTGAAIYYTTNGATPTTASTLYSGPITVSSSETLTAIAIKANFTTSAVATASYTINGAAATPTFSIAPGAYGPAQTIAITDATAGAAIYYTTNGATPTTASTLYSGPITVSASETLSAIAIAPNFTNSAIASATYTINGATATPTFSIAPGAYGPAQTVAITDATNGAAIYYTTNGATPTTASTLYSAPITVSASETLTAIAIAPNFTTSAIASASYTINGAAATPTFSIAPGAYGPTQTVAITDATNGAAIYYTTNGTTPTTAATLYSGPITVTSSESLSAIAIKANFTTSPIASATYTINGATATPTFSIAPGAYGPAQTVAIADATNGAAIYYTTNGATPTTASALYSGPITVSASETLSAIAIAPNFTNSAIASATYTINGAAATPSFSIAPGAYGPAQTISIADATAGATIYYTTNGATPTTASTLYSAPITVSASESLTAIAIAPNFTTSAIASATYTINGAAATPTFSIAPGAYGPAQSVAIADATNGAAIYYTTNGATPTTASTLYSGPITVSASETLTAIAISANYTTSAIASATYTINGATATPTFSIAPGAYGPAQSVAITDATNGATIYYTTNGATPTTAATLYSGPITVSASESLSAIAIAPNYTSSAIVSAAYTINGAAARPTFSVAPGAYGPAQTIAITDATNGAAIYYTTNGATPTTASTLYSGPITVSASETLRAIAIAPNFSNSAIASAAYTINGATATPTFSVAPGAYGPAQSVAIAVATTGAAIYYTTNGATPTTASTLYSGPITVSASESLSAIAIAPNFTTSPIASAAYTINGATATPTFSVAPGAYGPAQTIAITDATASAAIYYTTNGATPTTASTLYSGPITVSASETLTAIALKTNFTNSAVASAAYTINGATATPTFSIAPGAYGPAQTVAIVDAAAGAAIYYTTNGATPTTASTLYSGPITVSASETLSAISIAPNFTSSAIASAAYTINGAAATPTFSVASGAYAAIQTVSITEATTGATIYYTTNGAAPTTSSSLYSGPVTVGASETLTAIAIKANYINSAVASAAYTINGATATPSFSIAPGAYGPAQTITITDATTGAAIYYATNGATPTTASTLYSGPITVSASETLTAFAIAPNFSNSTIASAAYTINGAAATPTFSIAPGAYGPAQTVAIADATNGAAIYYTTNGATPTTASTLYSGPITVSASETLKAIAIAPNFSNSAIASATYTINGATATPTFSVASGAYGPAQTVAIVDATAGAAIYYTTNGATPTAASALYSAPITVSSSETLSSIAIAPNFTSSAIASATYTINGATATPSFSIAPGAYGPAQTIAITDATAGATIYYTTNGATPTTASTPYSSPITVSASETLSAIAIAPNFTTSPIASATYTINGTAATPTFSVASGAYAAIQIVSITDATAGATIYYTTNGAAPTTSSTLYSGPITVGASETLTAIAIKANYINSAVATAAYTITLPPATTIINLSSAFNVYAIFNDGSSTTNGGFDGVGYAFSAHDLSTSITWSGTPFTLGTAGSASGVANKTIALPAGTFANLEILASGAFGPLKNQVFVVTYSDGTTSSFTQSISDWGNPASFTGESIAATEPYRLTSNGSTQTGPDGWNIYGYSLALNTAKTPVSITLPNNRNVVVMAMTLVGSN